MLSEMFNKHKTIPLYWAAIAIAVVVTGTTVYIWQRSQKKVVDYETVREQRRLERQVEDLQADLLELKKPQYEMEKKITEIEQELKFHRRAWDIQKKIPENFFKIQGIDPWDDKKIDDFYVTIPADLSLSDKITFLAQILSKCRFDNLPINLLRIENRKGKNIAIIDLRESNESPSTWRGNYFQGSSGGHSTQVLLISTFLQEEHAGAWIDGVEFYYEGKPMTSNWDHIFLEGVKYRKAP
jgi:hypothetical protein